MRTPAGRECRYFYGDYYRGRNREECRLLDAADQWTPELCFSCPVPEIIQSNACEHMVLKPSLIRPFPFVKRQVRVKTYCEKTHRKGFDPHIGCGECHVLPGIFLGEDE